MAPLSFVKALNNPFESSLSQHKRGFKKTYFHASLSKQFNPGVESRSIKGAERGSKWRLLLRSTQFTHSQNRNSKVSEAFEFMS